MKIISITALMLIAIADAAAHETPAILHSHVLPFTIHPGALSLLAMGAIAAICFYTKVSIFRSLSRTPSRTD